MQLNQDQREKIMKEYAAFDMDEPIRQYAVFRNNTFEIVKMTVTEEDQRRMDQFNDFWVTVTAVRNMFQLGTSSYLDLTKYLQKENSSHALKDHSPVNKLVINFISDEKLFIDFLEHWCRENLKSDFEDWRKIQVDLYDNHLAYRLCYQLRNFAQHVGLPIQRINQRIVQTQNGEQQVTEYLLNRNTIVNDSKMMKKLKVSADFFSSDKNLSFIQYANEYATFGQMLYMAALKMYMSKKISLIDEVKDYLHSRKFFYTTMWSDVTKRQILEGIFLNQMHPIVTIQMIDEALVKLAKDGIIEVTQGHL